MNSMKKPFKAKALPAVVSRSPLCSAQARGLTSSSNRSLRSLGRAKARPLTKR
jgi:hypothetical protein